MTEAPGPSSEAAVAARLDGLVRRARVPGIQYVAVSSDAVLMDYAGGWAAIAERRPMRPATTQMAYSMSKTITAAAVLQLVEAGRVDLDAPADRYVDGLPYGPGVTVRHLMAHTSGIPNPIPLRWVHPVGQHAAFDEAITLAAVLRRHGTLTAAPGARYAYSNIGYWLLGHVVERASGQPFEAYVKEHVIARLGLTPGDLGYAIAPPGNHAHGYLEKYSSMNLLKRLLIDGALIGQYEGRWLHIHDHYLNGPAFGGLVGSAHGFGVFLQDQLRPASRLFGDAARRLFYEPQHTTAGHPVPMTLGWHVGTLDGVTQLYKEGGGGGFHCLMRVYRPAGIGTVVMTNATGFDVRGLLDTLDRHWLSPAAKAQR